MPPRPNKRARLSETSTTKPSHSPPPSPKPSSKGDEKHTLFTTWAETRGVVINSIAPQHLPNRGLGLLTTAPIKAGTRLLFVPEKAMFKPVPSTLQSATRARESSTPASPQAQLSISALEKFTASSSTDANDSSNLQTWQATWPTMQDFTSSMPLCWPEKLTAHLPPAVQAPLERQRADYARDWDAMSAYCAERGWGEGEFRYFWCIVNSRSFHWKPFSGSGAGGRAGSMVLCPFVDYMNHGPSGSGCRVEQGPRGYEVWAERDYEPGEEVLATYGAHSNDKLLVHYGFTCASPMQHASADDEIRLDHAILPHLPSETKSQLQDVGFLGAYALLPSEYPCERKTAKACEMKCRQPWEICFKTQVAVRAVLLTANEWEYFVTNGEDLSGDKSGVVFEWLKPFLEELKREAEEKVRVLGEMEGGVEREFAGAVGLLKGRWEQVAVHLGLFIGQNGK